MKLVEKEPNIQPIKRQKFGFCQLELNLLDNILLIMFHLHFHFLFRSSIAMSYNSNYTTQLHPETKKSSFVTATVTSTLGVCTPNYNITF